MSKNVMIPVLIIVALAIAVGALLLRQKSKESGVLVSQEVIKEEGTPARKVSEGLLKEEVKEQGRNFQLHLVAEIKSSPKTVYEVLVDYENLKDLIPDCTQLKVLETEGNKTLVYMKRFILFMGKEQGGNLEYLAYPEELKLERKVLRNPHANVDETYSLKQVGDKTHVIYHADVKPKLKVPIFMAQAWIKDDFIDFMKAIQARLEKQGASG